MSAKGIAKISAKRYCFLMEERNPPRTRQASTKDSAKYAAWRDAPPPKMPRLLYVTDIQENWARDRSDMSPRKKTEKFIHRVSSPRGWIPSFGSLLRRQLDILRLRSATTWPGWKGQTIGFPPRDKQHTLNYYFLRVLFSNSSGFRSGVSVLVLNLSVKRAEANTDSSRRRRCGNKTGIRN